MVVLDASAAVEWLMRTPTGSRVVHRIVGRDEVVHVPQLFKLEVAQVLRRHLMVGLTDPARAQDAIRDLIDMRVVNYAHQPFLWRVWELRHNLTAYDAAYVALAEELDAPLITCDARIASASGHHARVELI